MTGPQYELFAICYAARDARRSFVIDTGFNAEALAWLQQIAR